MAAVLKKSGRQSWSVAMFELWRASIIIFVRELLTPRLNDHNCHRILVRAPVKSGKREIVEYSAQRDYCSNPTQVHAFISAWHRKADDDQRSELRIHNTEVFSINNAKNSHACNEWIARQLTEGRRVILHIDECDYGSGGRQILGRIYREYRSHNMVVFVLYSATPQEVLFSGELDEEDEAGYDADYEELVDDIMGHNLPLEYVPPPNYCGAARFLDEGLVFDAKPFFYYQNDAVQLSPQGKEIMADLRRSLRRNPQRNVIVLRLSSGEGARKDNKQIYQFLNGIRTCPELQGVEVIADNMQNKNDPIDGIRSQTIEWSNESYWEDKILWKKPTICVIDQTASRSTEFVCHHRIFAMHDFRNKVVYTTVSQAQERVCHYASEDGGSRYRTFQPIRVYGHRKTFELSAGLIDYGTFMTNPWYKKKIDCRRAARMQHQGDRYEIKNTVTNELHVDYCIPLPLLGAERVLLDLDSFVEVKVSPRVRGRIKRIPIIGCEFIPCTQETFASKLLRIAEITGVDADIRNPFIRSATEGMKDGLWQGYLREWNVFDYNTVTSNSGWGIDDHEGSTRVTICYKNGTLGVAVRWNTGEQHDVSSLEKFKSMYNA